MPDKRRRLLRREREEEEGEGVDSWAEEGSDMQMDWETLVRVKREALEAELVRERKIARRGE